MLVKSIIINSKELVRGFPYSIIRKMSESGDNNIERCYEVVMNLVKEAGNLINEKFKDRDKKVERKVSNIDLVTETDKAVEKLLITGLSKEFSSHKFIGEEGSVDQKIEFTESPTWIIDPVDGTLNFVHSFPHSCVSIALFIGKKPEIGIIYNPMLNQMFTAIKGKGAFLNGERIRTSGTKNLSEALVMFEYGTDRNPERMKIVYENQKKIMPLVHGLRSSGSAALNMAMVALGAADAYFEYGVHVWDMAAGKLLVREAGGVVIDPAGGDVDIFSRRVLCASSCELAQQMSMELIQFYPTPD